MRKAVMGDFFHLEQFHGNDPSHWNRWGMSIDETWYGSPPWDYQHSVKNWNEWTYPGWHDYLKQLCIDLGVGVGSG